MTPIEPNSSSTTCSSGGESTSYSSQPVADIKRKPVHVAKALSAKEIRKSLKISKRDILIARRIVNKIRHK